MNSVTVKNKMTVLEFPTRVTAVTHWLPILGSDAYALYSLYLCFHSLKVEIGLRKIGDMLGLSQTSVRRLNRWLELCGLVEILPGTPTKPNEVHLLDPKEVTPQLLSDLWAKMLNDPVLAGAGGSVMRRQITQRLESYKSLYDLMPSFAPAPAVNGVNGVNGNGNGHHSPPAVNLQTQKILHLFGVQGQNLLAFSGLDPAYVLGWCLQAAGQKRLNNPPAYVVKRLEESSPLPPRVLELCNELLQMTFDDYFSLRSSATYRQTFGSWNLDRDEFPQLDNTHLELFADFYKMGALEFLEKVLQG